jgi:unsaturated chondroitin disaccharide hydrolase
MKINSELDVKAFEKDIKRFFELAGPKINRLHKEWDPGKGTPVFTVNGQYTTRGWTEWTQGFMYGCQILQFDGTCEKSFLKMGRENTIQYMAPHVSHTGVHDHGFNNVSTYGNLRRLAKEGRTKETEDACHFYEMALKVSGAVQAARWSAVDDGTGYICSFNGPQSLFSDTIRSCRALVLADALGQVLMGEHDSRISLLDRAMQHIRNTLKYNVYYGEDRDIWDVPGRVVHESIFNMNDGRYRCPSTQQGYSPFSTWTRGLAWIILGCAEQLEYFSHIPKKVWKTFDSKGDFLNRMEKAAKATADFYIKNTASDGIPYWDTGAPGLVQLGDWRSALSQPDNPWEPVDSSAAAITAQGLIRLGKYFTGETGQKYYKAGLTASKTLFAPPYLSESAKHHGLLLHSVYHRPNGWDHVPRGQKVPCGESSMWGDYHAMELAVLLQREMKDGPYPCFFCEDDTSEPEK